MIAHALRRPDGLKTIDFSKQYWNGNRREATFVIKQIDLALRNRTSGTANIAYILDPIAHPSPFIPEDVLYRQRIDVTRKQDAVARHIAQIQELEQWNAQHLPFVLFARHRMDAANGLAPPNPEEMHHYYAIMVRMPVVDNLVPMGDLVTPAEARQISRLPDELKKIDVDAIAVIDTIKLHISVHMQGEFKPIWDSHDAHQTNRNKAIASMAHLVRYKVEATTATLSEIEDNIKALPTIFTFEAASSTADILTEFQTELTDLSTPDNIVYKSDAQLIQIIVDKLDSSGDLFNHFKIHHQLQGTMASNKAIIARQYGEFVPAIVEIPRMTWDDFKRAMKKFHETLNPEDSKGQVFSNSFGDGGSVYGNKPHAGSWATKNSPDIATMAKQLEVQGALIQTLQSELKSSPGKRSRSSSPAQQSSGFSSQPSSPYKPTKAKYSGGGHNFGVQNGATRDKGRQRQFEQSKSPRPAFNRTSATRGAGNHNAFSAQEIYASDVCTDVFGNQFVPNAPDGDVWHAC